MALPATCSRVESQLDDPTPTELFPITPHQTVMCESCEHNRGAYLVVLPRNDDDIDEGVGRPRFVVCSPCAEAAA